jgi:hypothetical protein
MMSINLRGNRLTLEAGRAARSMLQEHPALQAVDMRLNTTRKLAMLRVRAPAIHRGALARSP